MEKSFFDWNRETLTLPLVRVFVHAACRDYGLKPPAVRQHNTQGATYSRFPDHISFQPRHKNPAIALHEVAHYICDSIFGDEPEDHGPEWLGIYLWLLEKFKVVPRIALHAEASALHLAWWPASAVSPNALRNRVRTPARAGSRSNRRNAGR